MSKNCIHYCVFQIIKKKGIAILITVSINVDTRILLLSFFFPMLKTLNLIIVVYYVYGEELRVINLIIITYVTPSLSLCIKS